MNESDVLLPGQRLRAEREARGMTEADAAGHLNLTVNYLKALEADDYERLPQAAFIKGYIRNYARLLELPGDELANLFDEMMAEERQGSAEGADAPQPRKRRSGLTGGVVLVVIVLAMAFFWLGGDQGGDEADDAAGSPAGTEAEGTQGGEAAPERPDPSAEEPSEPQADMPPQEPSDGVDEVEPPADNDSPVELTTLDAAASGDDRLAMEFTAQCWVEVRDATDQALFQGQRSAGSRLELRGESPFDLRIGDASAVAMISVNGQDVSMPSSAPGRVVRLSVP